MKAYFVFDSDNQQDLFVIPETGQLISAGKENMYQFISPQPDFSQWHGDELNNRLPEMLGTVVASRKSDGDVCIVEETLWHERMTRLLGAPR